MTTADKKRILSTYGVVGEMKFTSHYGEVFHVRFKCFGTDGDPVITIDPETKYSGDFYVHVKSESDKLVLWASTQFFRKSPNLHLSIDITWENVEIKWAMYPGITEPGQKEAA